jgi:hypothetical protein
VLTRRTRAESARLALWQHQICHKVCCCLWTQLKSSTFCILLSQINLLLSKYAKDASATITWAVAVTELIWSATQSLLTNVTIGPVSMN